LDHPVIDYHDFVTSIVGNRAGNVLRKRPLRAARRERRPGNRIDGAELLAG
jgi:hypothetical protein